MLSRPAPAGGRAAIPRSSHLPRPWHASSRVACSASGQKKAVVVGAGWAGLAAAHHLVNQGYAVDVLEASPNPGGLVAGWTTAQGRCAGMLAAPAVGPPLPGPRQEASTAALPPMGRPLRAGAPRMAFTASGPATGAVARPCCAWAIASRPRTLLNLVSPSSHKALTRQARRNIFKLIEELGLDPFTDWTPSNQYSPEGLEVVAPIFRVRHPPQRWRAPSAALQPPAMGGARDAGTLPCTAWSLLAQALSQPCLAPGCSSEGPD